MPTGYGKTLCFALPALLLPNPSLIIYPLRALIADQERRFTAMGISCVALVGGLSESERQSRLRQLQTGQARLVLANPEILLSPTIQKAISHTQFSHLVFDEAHVIELWGKSFRPAYANVAGLLAKLKWQQVSAFTATADAAIIQGIKSVIGDGMCYHLAAPSDRPEIHYRVIHTPHPELSLHELLFNPNQERRVKRPCIVFLRNRKQCEWLSVYLGHHSGYGPVKFYHAGLSHAEKMHTEHWFFHSQDGVLVSTNAYGMGVDKSNIRTVIHLGLPDSPAAYLQESGRAGRDKERAEAIAIVKVAVVGNIDIRANQCDTLFWDNSQCRRASLAQAMGLPSAECHGCDVCEGSVSPIAPEYQQLNRFLKKHSRQYQLDELSSVIARDTNFRHFSRKQIRQLVNTALQTRLIGFSRSPLSWQRIYAMQSRR